MTSKKSFVKVPRRFHSRRQWVRWTKIAADYLVANHGYSPDAFIRIGNQEPSLYSLEGYPKSFTRGEGGPNFWLFANKVPRGGLVFWPHGTDHNGEAYDPRDPVELLTDILSWTCFGAHEAIELKIPRAEINR